MGLAGIRPLSPGFGRCEIRPQLAGLELLELTAHTVRGPLRFRSQGKPGDREVTLEAPRTCDTELVVDARESLTLPAATGVAPSGCARYRLPAGRASSIRLQYT